MHGETFTHRGLKYHCFHFCKNLIVWSLSLSVSCPWEKVCDCLTCKLHLSDYFTSIYQGYYMYHGEKKNIAQASKYHCIQVFTTWLLKFFKTTSKLNIQFLFNSIRINFIFRGNDSNVIFSELCRDRVSDLFWCFVVLLGYRIIINSCPWNLR